MSNNNESRLCFYRTADDDEVLSLCLCDGTSKYIHKKCLEKWRSTANNSKAREKCMACNAKYQIKKTFALETYFIKFLNFDEYSDNQKSIINIFYITFLTAQFAMITYLMSLNNRIKFFNDNYLFNRIIILNKREYFLINFSFLSFLYLVGTFIVFLKKILKKINRKYEYFYFNSMPLTAQFLFMFILYFRTFR